MLDRNHYIQNRLLKNFATKSDNEKYKICVLDLVKFTADYRNTESAFYEKNLYDISGGSDTKELEKKFNELIEKPMVTLLKRIEESTDKVIFNRNELEIIKKYCLLQRYRTPRNKMSYTNPPKNVFELSQFNQQEGENKEDFWKREMNTILDHNIVELTESDLIGVRENAMNVYGSFMMIIRTNDEFCINDLGCVMERMPIQIPKDKEEEYIKTAKDIGKKLYGKDNFDEAARLEIENQSSHIDNFAMHPISSNYAILLVSPIWKDIALMPALLNHMPIPSLILLNHLTLPQNEYVNSEKIKEADPEESKQYYTQKDKFIYKIQTVNEEETVYLNRLTLNEAYRYIGFKTPKKIIPSIRSYNELQALGQKNMHNNLNGYVELLSKL